MKEKSGRPRRPDRRETGADPPPEEKDGVFYYAEPDPASSTWRTDSLAMEEGEAPVMYGCSAWTTSNFGDMELC